MNPQWLALEVCGQMNCDEGKMSNYEQTGIEDYTVVPMPRARVLLQ